MHLQLCPAFDVNRQPQFGVAVDVDDVASMFFFGHDGRFQTGRVRAALVAVVQFRTGLSQKADRPAS